ncbi:hypothetical protein LKMONMHP_0755 [Methylobacterium organophilum]|uniref:Tetratricopeptide TPR_4 protein n=2 Tax=Methylobacterium organophilum TaxID=410 RepID=A0ABQ4T755_METOR|nr:hypothetical protein LKMONMHP_0755 [Methylobacterium organophilum]
MKVGAETGKPLRRVRRAARMLVLLAAGMVAAPISAQAAKLLSAIGSQPQGFGRIILSFDTPVPVKGRISGTVLVLSYGERVSAGPERIATGMPDFVTAVRRDPDGSALRLALQKPYRISVQEAGEQVYIDLLPESWTGFPPPLPPEVVAELARRAERAEAALKARNAAPPPKTLAVELALTPGRARLSLKLPSEAVPNVTENGGATSLSLPGAWHIDDRAIRGRLDAKIGKISVENDEKGARLVATPAQGVSTKIVRDEADLAIDLLTKPPGPAPEKAAETLAQTILDKATKNEAAADPAGAAGRSPPNPSTKGPPPTVRTAEPPASATPRRRAGTGLVFPFKAPVKAAFFERAGILTAVFETDEPVIAPQKQLAGLSAIGGVERSGRFALVRYAKQPGRLVDLVPVREPDGWEIVAGDDLTPSESLIPERQAGSGGRMGITVPLPAPGGAHWLTLDGERVAVVTAGAGRQMGIPKAQRFVDFELLPSRVGLAVLAVADDLNVRPDLDGVTIGRIGGLALSSVSRPADAAVGPVADLVIDSAAWNAARRGAVRSTLRERFATVVAAERTDRPAARVALAKAMMANGLDAEAVGVLAAATAEDPVLDNDKMTVLMRGILAARLGRAEEAVKLLSQPSLLINPEARLWRGFAEVQASRWKDADADLRAGESVLARYPEDLVSVLQAASAEAAVEIADWDAAAQASEAALREATPEIRDRMAYLRAKVDEATGRTAAALESYEALSANAVRPVAAAAALRAALVANAMGKMAAAEVIERLEVLVLTWHGGNTEIETMGALGRLYTEVGRWRAVFTMTRRANALAPDAPATRTLNDAALKLFEDLYLGERADKLGAIEALSLYFDFKDFAPAGRRADEIVRRLADRLVSLDLLDSADELLDHQVNHRLTGPARSSVAARLATVRLMEGKPLDALQTLDATYLPELPEDLRRARSLLRARALSDLTRTDLALESIEGETGPDIDRLRADILWSARRWREAGEAHEGLLGEAWRSGRPLDDAARGDVIRAAIAYGLSGESLGLERLKAKFSAGMAETSDARTFTLLTRSDAPRTTAFRDIARRATSAETLASFLAEYRKRYPDSAVPERGKPEAGAGSPAQPAPETRAEAPQPPPPG